MRLSNDKLAEIIRKIRKSTKLNQKRFIVSYGSSIGVPDDSTLSRLESGARPISDRVVEGYAATFPRSAALLQGHLLWKHPRVLDDRRRLTIERQADRSFQIDEHAESTLAIEYYLFAHVRGQDVARNVQSRVPSLFGFRVWPTDADLAQSVLIGQSADLLVYFVDTEAGNTEAVEFEPQPLSLAEVAQLGGDVEELSPTDVMFFGCQLGHEGFPKRFVSDTHERRRPTLREWYWSTVMPCRNFLHQIHFKLQPDDDPSSFMIRTFAPSASVTRGKSPQTVSFTINCDSELRPGHGWIAMWLNPSP